MPGGRPVQRLVMNDIAFGAFNLQLQRCAGGVCPVDEGGGMGYGVNEDCAAIYSLAGLVYALGQRDMSVHEANAGDGPQRSIGK